MKRYLLSILLILLVVFGAVSNGQAGSTFFGPTRPGAPAGKANTQKALPESKDGMRTWDITKNSTKRQITLPDSLEKGEVFLYGLKIFMFTPKDMRLDGPNDFALSIFVSNAIPAPFLSGSEFTKRAQKSLADNAQADWGKSLETELVFHKMENGYYYTLTDADPEAGKVFGEYKFTTRGLVVAPQNTLLSFEMTYNPGNGEKMKDVVLKSIENIR